MGHTCSEDNAIKSSEINILEVRILKYNIQ